MNNQIDFQPQLENQQIILNKQPILHTDLFAGLTISCPYKQPAYQYCCQQECQQNAVTCQNQNCNCHLKHQNCQNFLKVKKFNQKINQKVQHDLDNEILEIQSNVNKIVDKVSEMQDELVQELKYFGLNKNEEEIKDILRSHFDDNISAQQMQIITGKTLSTFRSKQKQAQKTWLGQSLLKYKKIVQYTKKLIDPIFQRLQNTLEYMHNKINSQQSLSDFFLSSNIFKFEQPGISSLELKFLLKTLSESINISGIKKIYNYNKAKLIKNAPVLHDKNFIKRNPNYNKQAMQDQMKLLDVKKVLNQITENCQGKSNLLFVIQNIKGKKTAVYTPCKLVNNSQWIEDTTQKSLLFGINNSHYQKLSNYSFGLKISPDKIEIGNGKYGNFKDKINGFNLNFKNNDILTEMIFKQTIQTKFVNQGLNGLNGLVPIIPQGLNGPFALMNQNQGNEGLNGPFGIINQGNEELNGNGQGINQRFVINQRGNLFNAPRGENEQQRNYVLGNGCNRNGQGFGVCLLQVYQLDLDISGNKGNKWKELYDKQFIINKPVCFTNNLFTGNM